MRLIKTSLLLFVFVFVAAAAAQSPEPPLSESRLTVHTLLREDAFAGFLSNDMERFTRAERNAEILLKERPQARGELLAWKGGMMLYRAVVAHEAGKADEFKKHFQSAQELFAEAAKLSVANDGVIPTTAGSLSLFADRLPAEHRAAAWTHAYQAYSMLWKAQEPILDKLPVHFRGELLGGLAQSAQRTGRMDESNQYVDRMLTAMQGTPYEATAKEWKANPASAAGSKLTCKNCHNPGRLSARLTALQQQ